MSSMRALALSIGFLGISFFIGALLWEHVGQATPCVMCYIERWFFLLAGVFGIMACLSRRLLSTQRLLGVVAFIFMALSVVLLKHLGTQYKWFRVPGICRSSRPLSEADLSEQLLSPLVEATCDRIEFLIFGQPPTFYLLGIALGLGSICFWAFFRKISNASSFSRRR